MVINMLYGYKIIALCLSRIQDATSIDFVSQLHERLIEHGYRMFVFHVGTDSDWDERNIDSSMHIFERIDYAIVDAVIIMDEKIKNRMISEQVIANAKKANIPAIIVDGYYDNCVNVQFDYKAGFEKVVEHVMNMHKPKRPHMLAGIKGNKFSEERIEVFRKVIEAHGICFQENMVSYGDFWAKPAIKALQKLWESDIMPDAIICANDNMAINTVAFLQQHGYRVPDDIIVTGFDGIEEVHMTEPRITTAGCDYRMLADMAAEAVIAEVKKGDFQVMPALMKSESCGCMYSAKLNILNDFNKLNSRFYRYYDDNRILTQIAESMQLCQCLEEVPDRMKNRVMGHMCCVLNQWCADVSANPMQGKDSDISEKKYLLYDAGSNASGELEEFEVKKVVPRLEMLLEQGYPLIFTELDFMNVSFGYACFFYKSCDHTDYMMIPHVVTALNNGIGGLLNRRHQKYLTTQIEHIYKHDALTGLYNRLGFMQECEKQLIRLKGSNTTVTVIMADLDGLKRINDDYGHVAGDEAIRTVANALKSSCIKQSLCVRFGGDEMLAVMEGKHDGEAIRDKIRSFLDEYNQTSNKPYTVATSLGILHVQGKEIAHLDDALKKVDELMYADKMNRKKRRIE